MNLTVSTGYTASLDAVDMATQCLSTGPLKCLLAGGVEELSEEFLLSYIKQGLVSENSFIGEGSVIFSIERLSDALFRRAKIYCEVSGYGSVFDHSQEGLRNAIELALEDGDMNKEEIDWIVKGVNLGQTEKEIQSQAIERCFGHGKPTLDLGSVLGDSYSAGGSFQIAAGLGLIKQKAVRKVLAISIDPCGNCSALIISAYLN
jgi:3-oxoacyl-(acyl-carrier-protein) synthase